MINIEKAPQKLLKEDLMATPNQNQTTEKVSITPEIPRGAYPGPESIKVTPLKVAAEVNPADMEQVWAWYGSKRECPFFNLSLGGVCFAREIHQTRRGAEGVADQLVPLDGNFHKISKLRISEIKECVAKTVLRLGGGRAEVWDVKSPNYIPDAMDVPAGRFIYMQIVREGQPFDRRADSAPSMS